MKHEWISTILGWSRLSMFGITASIILAGCDKDAGIVQKAELVGRYVDDEQQPTVVLDLFENTAARLTKVCLDVPACTVMAEGGWLMHTNTETSSTEISLHYLPDIYHGCQDYPPSFCQSNVEISDKSIYSLVRSRKRIGISYHPDLPPLIRVH
jgi:hypothetical protein